MLGPREAALGLMIIKLECEHKKIEERGIESLLLGWPKCSFGFPYHLKKKKKKKTKFLTSLVVFFLLQILFLLFYFPIIFKDIIHMP